MRALVQRVTSAAVEVDGEEVARISPPDGGQGLLVLLGVGHGDDPIAAANLARRVWRLRILDEEKSASDVEAPVLVVSQFTLMADTSKSRRPSWSPAAPRAIAEPLVDAFGSALRELGAMVEVGRFGEHMRVSLVNDGPVTVLLEG